MAEPRQPETLDDLLARAEHFAGFAMRQMGRVPPALMAVSPDGALFFVPSTMADDRAKDNFANIARLICVAHAATAAVMILEAWMKLATPGNPLDPSEPPSEAIDRKEVVLLTGESRSVSKQKFLPIIRTDAGGFFGFGEFDGPSGDSFTGRFSQILSPQPPMPEMQARARMLLATLGITDASLRGKPPSN